MFEFEGEKRRPGLWARVFSESRGNEAVAKAAYLDLRVGELKAQQTAARQLAAKLAADEEEPIASEKHLAVEQNKPGEPKGTCPRCGTIVLFRDAACHACNVRFNELSGEQVVPSDDESRLSAIKFYYAKGLKPTIDEVRFLVSNVAHDKALVRMVGFGPNRETLLHCCATYNLVGEAIFLVTNGADASAKTHQGVMPYQLTLSSHLREYLASKAKDRELKLGLEQALFPNCTSIPDLALLLTKAKYITTKHSGGWKIKEPHGGRVTLRTDSDLIGYAIGRVIDETSEVVGLRNRP